MNYLIGADFIFRGALTLFVICIANKVIDGKTFKESITISNVLIAAVASFTAILNINWIISILIIFTVGKLGNQIDNLIAVK